MGTNGFDGVGEPRTAYRGANLSRKLPVGKKLNADNSLALAA